VASCVPYFSLVSMFWHVFYCQLKCSVCWQNLTRFLIIHSRDKQWRPIQCDVASISKTEFHCRLIKSMPVVQLEGMTAHTEGAKSHLAPMQHLSGTSLRMNCSMFFKKIKHVTSTSMWVAISNICITTVNMRNEFHYKISENIHCPQKVQLFWTHSK
jgi:hypothetical protein